MASFVFSPQWFLGKDLLIDLVSFFALFAIAAVTFQFYRINKRTEHKLMAVSFSLLAASFLAKIMTYVVIYYYQLLHLREIEVVAAVADNTFQGIRLSYIMFALGFSFYRFAHLAGLYFLYSVYQEKKALSDTVIILFLFFMITYFSHNSFFAFHLASLVLLLLMTWRYYQIYLRNRLITTRNLMISFFIIALSQAIFIFQTNPLYYVAAEIIQFFGYFILLITFFTVLYNGKKKKSH
ncbi:MAG: hypothetical protein ACLFP2_02515 [Candidatus Woesearchaeota archaeon]